MPVIGEQHHHQAGRDGASGIEGVAAEDLWDPTDRQVPQRATADRGDGAQQHRRQPAQAEAQGLLRASGGPATQGQGVDDREGHRPEPVVHRREERDDRPRDRGNHVQVVGQCDRRAVLQQGVTDEPAAEAGQDGQHDKSDGVHAHLACHNAAEQGIAEDPGEVDHPEKLTNRAGQHNPPGDAVRAGTP